MRAKQLHLDLKPIFKHGGARPGSGRPRRSKLQPHRARKSFRGDREPLHVTLRLRAGRPKLRGKHTLRQIRRAIQNSRRKGLRVIHYSILSNHIHLLVESSDQRRLGRQMQSFGITLAKRLNTLWGFTGPLFTERYFPVGITSPTQARHALEYVLTNEWKHEGEKGRIRANIYSTAALFGQWKELLGKRIACAPEPNPLFNLEALRATVDEPRTWFLAKGWLRA